MPALQINIDVPDLERAAAFYTAALGFQVRRRILGDVVELTGAPVPVFLLAKKAGTTPAPGAAAARTYGRHWTPVHLDLLVDDLEAALSRAESQGATVESACQDFSWGKIAYLADPFGNGFCLIHFTRGY